MNVLDENIPASQRLLLENWRLRPRQIGVNLGRRGLQDDEIVVFLQKLRRPTFFTRDEDFYDRQLVHAKYALVYLAVERHEVAHFVRRASSSGPGYAGQANGCGRSCLQRWVVHLAIA